MEERDELWAYGPHRELINCLERERERERVSVCVKQNSNEAKRH